MSLPPLQPGDGFLFRAGTSKLFTELVSLGEYGLGDSQWEHVAGTPDGIVGWQQAPEYADFFDLKILNAAFDAGQIRIIRHHLARPRMLPDFMTWAKDHRGPAYPYGWSTIARFALDDLTVRLADNNPAVVEWLKIHESPANLHAFVCSIGYGAMLGAGIGKFWPAPFGLSISELMPSSYSLPCFQVVADNAKA